MARPPYLRWLAAAGIIAIGLLIEFSDRATTPHPFVATDVAAGTVIAADDVEWRDVPGGYLVAPRFEGLVAATDLTSGTPLLKSLLRSREPTPVDWWAVPVPVPPGIPTGAEVQLVLTLTGERIPGRIVAAAVDTGFGFENPGLVAIPPDHVAAVAAAAATSDLVVAVRPAG
jgi:hypothetical protein